MVRDITDISHPKTVSTAVFGSSDAIFVTATEVSYPDAGNNLVRQTFTGQPTVVVKSLNLALAAEGLFDWSPDGTTAVYVTTTSGTEVRQVSGGQTRLLGTVPAFPGVFGCETQSCADGLDWRLAYSRDGRYVSWVQTLNDPVIHLWASDGTLLKNVRSVGGMSVWSGGKLYFRVAGGVDVWQDGVVSSFLPGVAWIRPKGSPGGGQIVYESRDAQGWSHTYVVDTITRRVREIKKARQAPVFLTSRYIWYEGERSCVPSDSCIDTQVTASGKTYIYDLHDGTEAESIITSVFDVWPHAA